MASQASALDGAPVSHAALLRPRRASEQQARWRRLAWRVLVLSVLVAMVLWVKPLLFTEDGRPQRRAQRVTLVNAPKPPPPKPVEKPPEVVVERQPVALETAAQPERSGPQDDALGVDADGSGAGDGFGLVGKRGGQDIITLGDVKVGEAPDAGVVFRQYAALIRQRIEGELVSNRELAIGDHVSVVNVWVGPRGTVDRMDIERSDADTTIQRVLREAFAAMPVLPEPPTGMPMPLRMRITARELKSHG